MVDVRPFNAWVIFIPTPPGGSPREGRGLNVIGNVPICMRFRTVSGGIHGIEPPM